ncbi:hypothetical protein BZG36_03156 [Bifiguratus adelaidae]|uniref:Aminoglycoside phosphotransferase domain-containing protein n=1 Tax=Bifiguratus adelaidae TaxID=1938954 RepID=A0A261Y153_9FUNG|nr:hypothetical protein BZG36_03156 [Bifiguratus adelaidae]
MLGLLAQSYFRNGELFNMEAKDIEGLNILLGRGKQFAFDAELLSGGNINYVYRVGIRDVPETSEERKGVIDAGVKSVVVKHYEDHIRVFPTAKFSVDRAVFEARCLAFLNSDQNFDKTIFPPDLRFSGRASLPVRTPKIYHFDQNTRSIVMEDIGKVPDLPTWLSSPSTRKEDVVFVARSIASWVLELHKQTCSVDALSRLRPLLLNHTVAATLDEVHYGHINELLRKSLDVEHAKALIDFIRETNERKELLQRQDVKSDSKQEPQCLILGDLWPYAIHVQEMPVVDTNANPSIQIYLLDFEFATISHPVIDAAQLLPFLHILQCYPETPLTNSAYENYNLFQRVCGECMLRETSLMNLSRSVRIPTPRHTGLVEWHYSLLASGACSMVYESGEEAGISAYPNIPVGFQTDQVKATLFETAVSILDFARKRWHGPRNGYKHPEPHIDVEALSRHCPSLFSVGALSWLLS